MRRDGGVGFSDGSRAAARPPLTGMARRARHHCTVHCGPAAKAEMINDPISEDEVFERLRADLATRGLALRRGTLDGMAADSRGRFFSTREGADEIVERDVDIERAARQRGLLEPNEAMVPAHGEGL